MTFDLKELELHKSYQFDVVVSYKTDRYAGQLVISPQIITLRVMGEIHDERPKSFNFSDIEKITCSYSTNTFVLYDLKVTSGKDRTICRHPKNIGFFELVYSVGYLLFYPGSVFRENTIISFWIHSTTVSRWIGNTKTQENIISSHHKPEPDDDPELTEFIVTINNIGVLGVAYNLSIYYSSPEFKSGIVFPPFLFFEFKEKLDGRQIKQQYDKTCNLLSYITGNDLVIEKVTIGHLSSTSNNPASLYYPIHSEADQHTREVIFYPLGSNLRFDTLGLPELPKSVFNNYFSLKDQEAQLFLKYLRYKKMQNVEERFLGFFRLLENMCFRKKDYLDSKVLSELLVEAEPYMERKFNDLKNVKSFLRGIPRYNNSKYNTAKCIQDYFSSLPKTLTGTWQFAKGDIPKVCNLRNDITHANDHDISEEKIRSMTKFIEILLIFSLGNKIGINSELMAKLIDRINGSYSIKKNS